MHSKISVRIDNGLKEGFRTFCEEKDVSCSEMLRRMILMLIGKESEHDYTKEGNYGKISHKA